MIKNPFKHVIATSILAVASAFLLSAASPAYAGPNNNFSQGGKWNKLENPKCGSGCRSYDPGTSSAYQWIASINTAVSMTAAQMQAAISGTLTYIPNMNLWSNGALAAALDANGGSVIGFVQSGMMSVTYSYPNLQGITVTNTYNVPAYYMIGTNNNNNNNNNNNPGNPTPTPTQIAPATILARAVNLPTVPLTCDDIVNATDSSIRYSTKFSVKQGTHTYGPLTQSATDSSYVVFSVPPGTWTMLPETDTTHSIHDCLTDSVGQKFGVYSDNIPALGQARFDVAYAPLGPWFQAQGGDVYSANSILSAIGANANPKFFNLNATGNFTDGVVTYGGSPTSFDFASGTGNGAALVSNDGWLVNDSKNASMNFYNYFYSKLGSPASASAGLNQAALTDPGTNSTTPYYLTGDVTTSGNWTVGNGESEIFLINGNLNINGKINITGNGFVMFIVNGNITVADAVGSAWNDPVSPADVEGIYLANGSFNTGYSTIAGARRLVGKGVFIADSFNFNRDLVTAGHNDDTSAELFIFNPKLVLEMPDALNAFGVTWQEVAP